MNEKYLTPEDFAIAESNGIPRHIVRARMNSGNFSKRRAISVPYTPRPTTHRKYKEELKKSGVDRNLFYCRIRQGWDEERAATEPKLTQEERVERAVASQRKIPKEIRKLASENGIGLSTLRQRIGQYKWDHMKAATEPIKTQFRRKES